MYYIYTLSIDGAIFYVGLTKTPISRYKNHYHDTCSSCYQLTRYWLKVHGLAMKMNIIAKHNDKDAALRHEQDCINNFSKIYPLLNNQHWPWLFTRPIPKIDKLTTFNNIHIKRELKELREKIKQYE